MAITVTAHWVHGPRAPSSLLQLSRSSPGGRSPSTSGCPGEGQPLLSLLPTDRETL